MRGAWVATWAPGRPGIETAISGCKSTRVGCHGSSEWEPRDAKKCLSGSLRTSSATAWMECTLQCTGWTPGIRWAVPGNVGYYSRKNSVLNFRPFKKLSKSAVSEIFCSGLTASKRQACYWNGRDSSDQSWRRQCGCGWWRNRLIFKKMYGGRNQRLLSRSSRNRRFRLGKSLRNHNILK